MFTKLLKMKFKFRTSFKKKKTSKTNNTKSLTLFTNMLKTFQTDMKETKKLGQSYDLHFNK